MIRLFPSIKRKIEVMLRDTSISNLLIIGLINISLYGILARRRGRKQSFLEMLRVG